MKKSRLLIALLFVLLFMVGNGIAGTIAHPEETIPGQKFIEISCTADGTAFDDTVIGNDDLRKLEGFWLSHVFITPGATGPTDDSDLDITVGGSSILGAKGVNANGLDIVDETTDGYCVPYGSTGDAQFPVLLGKPLTVSLSGNSVSAAEVTIILLFDRGW